MNMQATAPVKLETKNRIEIAIPAIIPGRVWKSLTDEQQAAVHRLLAQSCRQLLCRETAHERG